MYHLVDFGSFYINGREIKIKNEPIKTVMRNPQVSHTHNPNGIYTIESMYVQYFIPENSRQSCVLIHGGGHTGAVWDRTPDGREGWLQLLLKKNYAVYVVDTVERGRSGWCSIPNIWQGEPEQRTQEAIWEGFRIGSKENFKTKTPYPNQQFPVEQFYQLTQYDVPRWNCNGENSARALHLLLKQIGKCSLIAHSQGADVAMRCYNLAPSLVNKIVLLEPAAFPTLTSSIGEKITVSFIHGDFISDNPFWANLKKMTLDYSQNLSTQGLDIRVIDLPHIGIKGNSHMLMMDKNSAEILNMAIK